MTKLIRQIQFFAAALVLSTSVGAATQVRSPTASAGCTSVGGIGTNAWSNPGNAISSNNSRATASVNDGQVTNYLRCLNYGFTIPTGATIDGIVVSVERESSSNSGNQRDAAVRLVKAGVIGASDRATTTNYSTSEIYEDHGTASDLWGTTWTAAQINATNFGVAFAAQKAGSSGGSRTISVDHIEITVHYTPPPSMISLNRSSANPTTPATAVAWQAIFDQGVTGVNAADFVLVQTGTVSGASITSVTGAGTTWTVNVNTGSGDGTLGLNLVDDDTIVNGAGAPLDGAGASGSFTGQIYTIPGPAVAAIARANATPTAGAASVSWTVTFNKSVSGVDAGDFALVAGGSVSGSAITSVTGAGTTWTVTAGTGTGTGTLGLNLFDNDSIVDGAGLKLGGTGAGNGNFTGEVYTVSASFCSPPSNAPPGLALTCVCDTFGRSNLNPGSTIYGGTWATSNSDGLGNPDINPITKLLRLTEKTASNAKAATVPAIFPAAGNYISVEFNHYAYDGNGADGIAVTLSDYTRPATPGGYGGSLGYAQRNDSGSPPGFDGGWVGIAMDEYGNFQNPTEGRVNGPGRIVQSVGVRGPGSGANGYRWMGGTASNPGGLAIDNPGSSAPAPGYMFQVIVDARASSSGTINVNVNRDSTTRDGTTYASLFGPFNAYTEADYALTQGWISQIVPDYWKVSFTGSTGGSNNIHEIGSLRICAQTVYPATGGTASGFSAIDDAYPVAANGVPAYPNFSTGDIYMKLAGTPFKLWVAALSSSGISGAYSAVSDKHLQVKMVDNTDNACGSDTARTCNSTCTNKAAVEAGGSQVMTMSSSNPGAKLSSDFTLNSAYKNLIAVIRECTTSSCAAFSATAPACSAGSFSVRPIGIATVVSTNANNVNIFKADSDQFTLTATTIGVGGSPSGYTGVLKINNAAIQPVGGGSNVAGEISPSTFPAAVSGIGASTATGGTFKYSEVGAFTLPGFVPSPGSSSNNISARGVYDGVDKASECDSPPLPAPGLTTAQCDALRAATWTGVDSITTKGDCILDSYSNVKVGGKYGCSFGTVVTSPPTIGRFVPDHFEVDVSGGIACLSALTCPCPIGALCPPAVSNGFVYSGQAFTANVTARNASGAITTNYDNARGYARQVTLSAWDAAGSTTTQNPPGGATPGSFAGGTEIVPASAFNLGRTIIGTPALPIYALPNIYPSATPPPGPTDIFIRAIDADSITSLRGVASVENGIKIVSGRIKLTNAHGSELQQLPIGVTAQYWNGTRYATSDSHSFTIPNANVVFSNCLKNLLSGGACKAAPIVDIVTPPDPIVMTNGVGTFTMKAPGMNNYGSADMSINLFGYLPSTTNRATFGIYRAGPIIYIRELY